MKEYFIQFDFWDDAKSFDKFYFGIITCDLSKTKLSDVCKKIVKENYNLALLGVSVEGVIIKVNALNNINIDA